MLPTQLHSYLLWRGSVKPDAQTLASRRFTATISLFPAGMVGIFVFGWYAGLVVLLSTLTAILTDTVFHRFVFKDTTGTRDGTWLITGVLLGLMLPPNVPLWLPMLGAILAIFLGKYWFSVDSMPLVQPAALGLGMLFLIGFCFLGSNPVLGLKNGTPHWPVLVRDIEPSTSPDKMVWEFFGGDVRNSVTHKEWRSASFSGGVAQSESGVSANAVHAPRPVDKIKANPAHYVGDADSNMSDSDAGETYTSARMIMGYVPSTIGGTSALALILGILFLIFAGANSWVIPVFGLGTMFSALHLLAWLYTGSASPLVIADNIPIHLLSGSTLLGAFYLAADSTTAPRSFMGKVYAGVAFGLFEVFFRIFTPLSEGIILSALCVQALSFVIDQWLAPPGEETKSGITVNLSSASLGRL